MEFNPETFIVGIDKTEGVATKTVHVTVRLRQTTVAEVDGQLVEGFRQLREEIPFVDWITQVGARVTFYHVVQVREFQRIAQIEDRSVVTYQIPVTFFGIKLHGEATNVAFCIGSATFTGDG